MQPLTRDATTILVRAITANIVKFGAVAVTLEEVISRSWASVTFTGARHELTLRLTGAGASEAAARFAESLDGAEFKLRGHFLADIALVASDAADDGVRLKIEALTVEE